MKISHLLITASMLTGLSAMAQSTPAAAPAAPVAPTDTSSAGTPHTRPMHTMRDMMMKRHVQHLNELKASLKLKPEQEAPWGQFAASMQPHASQTHPMAMVDMAKLTTPERIDKMTALKTQRDADMQKRGDATKAFYATLNDEQKKTFDQHTAKFMHRMGGEHHHGGPGHAMHAS